MRTAPPRELWAGAGCAAGPLGQPFRTSFSRRAGARAPPITLAAARAGDRVELSVADEGEGIAPGDRDRVLAPFYRGDRARTPAGPTEAPRGVGLGLTLARRVAEAHGGTIAIGPAAVLDGRERGCRVALILPASPADRPHESWPRPPTA